MKRFLCGAAAVMMVAALVGCGSKEVESAEASSTEGISYEDISSEALVSEVTNETADAAENAVAEAGSLAAPTVADGVMSVGEEAVETHFEWNAVDGAEGYEVSVVNKYCSDEEYSEAEIVETTDAFYVCSAQDDFDFKIQVRAFQGTGDDRVYSEWSNEAIGKTYEE